MQCKMHSLAKGAGFHEVSARGSVRSELAQKPVDKWGMTGLDQAIITMIMTRKALQKSMIEISKD